MKSVNLTANFDLSADDWGLYTYNATEEKASNKVADYLNRAAREFAFDEVSEEEFESLMRCIMNRPKMVAAGAADTEADITLLRLIDDIYGEES
jgi:hypothetical protein